MNLVWLDSETTGLFPLRDTMLALGIIVTDGMLNELARGEWLVKPGVLRFSDPKAREMHQRSGLLDRCHAEGRSELEVAEAAQQLITQASTGERHWAGSSVAFDVGFLNFHMPLLMPLCHYRLLDVSALRVLAKAWLGEEAPGGEPAHTPLADLEHSISLLRHWQQRMFRPGIGPAVPHG